MSSVLLHLGPLRRSIKKHRLWRRKVATVSESENFEVMETRGNMGVNFTQYPEVIGSTLADPYEGDKEKPYQYESRWPLYVSRTRLADRCVMLT